jgi:anaerobic selenocysteine-containing dehydrogenase
MPNSRDCTGERWGRTQCPYCGVGCGLLVQIQDGQAVRVKGQPLATPASGRLKRNPVLVGSPVHPL